MKGSRPDVIFVMLDTVRADFLSAYGGDMRLSTLDAIARKGVLYERAISPGTYTVPSHVSLFLGKRVKSIRAVTKDRLKEYDKNIDPFLRKAVYIGRKDVTLARHMGYLGYKTALFSNNPYVSAPTGLASGFEHISNVWLNSKIENNRPFVRATLGIVSSDIMRNRLIELACGMTRLMPEKNLDRLYMKLRVTLNKKFSSE
ncbi:Sulfatase [uncultured archaeon]|nr:Sulfatase [uncultured archaeon]